MKYSNNTKMVYRKITLLFIIGMLSLGNFSCKKIDNEQSTRLATEENNYKTLEDAKANLLSIYGLMRSATVADNAHWLLGDLRKGDFTATNRSDLKSIINGDLQIQNPVLNRITNWRSFYAVINAASIFIERSAVIVNLDPRYTSTNNQVDVAQARILRAFAYFYMVRVWGDVPLITSSHDGQFITAPRTDKSIVLSYCTNELLAAAKVVPFRYGGSDPILPGLYYGEQWSGWNGILFGRLSTYILLAHVAAWQGDYLGAYNYSQFVLDNRSTQANVDGAFNLEYIDMGNFTENVPNSPFAFKRATLMLGFPFEAGNGLSSPNGHIEQLTLAAPFIPKVTPEMYVTKDTILKVFTNGDDLRFSYDNQAGKYRTNYFYNFESDRPIFNKIKVISPDQTSGSFTFYSSSLVFSRLEEITLLNAEALAVLGRLGDAVGALNRVTDLRGYAYIPPPNVTQDMVIDRIFEERRRELMGEGWRWYDIIRYNRWKKSNGIFTTKGSRQLTFAQFEAEGGIYWPVSKDVINANPTIKQYPYWQ